MQNQTQAITEQAVAVLYRKWRQAEDRYADTGTAAALRAANRAGQKFHEADARLRDQRAAS